MAITTGSKPFGERVYVWELPIRLSHWVLFFAILILSATGFYIGHPFIDVPGEAKDHFVMGMARAIHLYTAIVFSLATLARIYWFFAGNKYVRLGEYIPLSARRWRSLWTTLAYYSFLRRDPEIYVGHNAIAAGSYLGIYLIYLLMIATGLALYTVIASAGSPFQIFGFLVPVFGGLQVARLIHHIGMWIIVLFVVMHIYFVVLASIVEHIGTFDSIISGYKFVPDQEADLS